MIQRQKGYKILQGVDRRQVVSDVETLQKDGWLTNGPLSVIPAPMLDNPREGRVGMYYVQSLVKYV